jgi:chromosome segregation ATPase
LLIIHSLCSRFDSVVQSVGAKAHTTEEFETFVGKQLQDLRSEILRFDELAAECRQAKESRDDLKRELEAERHQMQRLCERSEIARQKEEDLESRKAQLERQLADIDANVHPQNVKSRVDEQKMKDLQDKIKEVEDECSGAKAEVERLHRELQKRDRKLGDYEACGIPVDV